MSKGKAFLAIVSLFGILAIGCSECKAQSQVMRGEVSPGVYTNVVVDSSGRPILSPTSSVVVSNTVATTTGAVLVPQATIFANTSYTTSQTSADFSNTTNKGAQLNCNVTTIPLTQGITIALQGKDTLNGNVYYNLANGTYTATGYIHTVMYPGVANTTANAGGVSSNDFLPDTYRVVTTHSAGGTYVYGCEIILLK